jgi:hypothetical protein
MKIGFVSMLFVGHLERAFRLPVYPQSFRLNPSKLTADRRVVAHA